MQLKILGRESNMQMNEQLIFDLAKVIYDAKCKECTIGKERYEAECAKFPLGLKPSQYVVPQPWIDLALVQARAALKFLDSKEHATV